MNARTRIKAASVLLLTAILSEPGGAVAQSGPPRQIVRAGPATLQVTIKGEGEPM